MLAQYFNPSYFRPEWFEPDDSVQDTTEKPVFNGALAAAIIRDREIFRRRKKRQREEDALFLAAL